MNIKKCLFILIFLIILLGCLNNLAAESNITNEEISTDTMVNNEFCEIVEKDLENDIVDQCIENEFIIKEQDTETLDFYNTSDEEYELKSNYLDVNNDSAIGFEKLNEFRTTKGTWYWSSNDKTIIYFNTNDNNKLLPVFWDDELAECAKIRAEELSIQYSHQRPDGRDCFTAYPDYCYSENIAIGSKSSSIGSFKETESKYDGQSHRRNMLGKWNCVGIAGFVSEGIGYCVQAFGWNEKYVIKDNNTNQTIILDSTQGNFTELNNLINTNVEIELEKDYYYLNNEIDFRNGILITNSITINGHGHKIDANNHARIFKINAERVILKNIKFISGNEDYAYGGAIYCNQSNIIIENCSFINGSSYFGGGAYFEKCNVTIMKSTFSNNFAVEGTIYSNGGLLSILDSDFIDNFAVLKGGSVYTNANSTIEKNKFNTNTVDFFGGGAIYSTDNTIKIKNNVFTNNKLIEHDGGAIYLNNAESYIESNEFINNTSPRYGGAIYTYNSRITIIESNLFNNSIIPTKYYSYGGATYSENCNISILKSNFIQNSLKIHDGLYVRGGAMYIRNCNVTINESNFDNNSLFSNRLNGDGGAIYSTESNILIVKSNFTNNNVNSTFYGDGGAISSHYDIISIINCSFINNDAINVGGAICSRYDSIYFEGIDFINNKLSLEYSQGGAIYSYRTNGTIISSNFFNNTSKYSGKAMQASESDIIVINSTFYKKNTIRGNVTLINCTITNNPSLNPQTESNTSKNITDKRETYFETYDYYGIVNHPIILSTTLHNQNGWRIIGENIEYTFNNKKYNSFTQGQLGLSSFKYTFNKPGIYYFTVNYAGSDEYKPCNSTGKIIIKNPIEPKITTDIKFNNVTITVDLEKDINGEITINIDDSNKTWTLGYLFNTYIIKIKNGKAILNLNNLKERNYRFDVELNSENYVFENTINSEFTINVIKTYLIAHDVSIFAGNELNYKIELKHDEIGLENHTVNIELNNKSHVLKTDKKGIINLQVNLTNGNYPITITYNGSNNTFLPVQIVKNVLIKSTIILPKNIQFNYNSKFEVKLLNKQGNPLSNTNIEVIIDNMSHNLKTDNAGKLSIMLNFGDGNHIIKIKNTNTGEFIKHEITIKTNNNAPKTKITKKINPKKIIRTKNIVVKKSKIIKFSAKLYNTNGKIIKGKKVTFKFKGKKYKIKTNKKGIATLKLKIKLKKGKYLIKTIYEKYTVKNKIRIK